MLSFQNDYSEGAAPEIIEALAKTNLESLPGYGSDQYCLAAQNRIKEVMGNPDADIFFLVGGTQTNAIAIDAFLQSYQAVISADSGHINIHEAGAIEAGGHKVIALKANNGKLEPRSLKEYLVAFYEDENHPHMAQPGMVYISQPTELGTLYSKTELQQLHKISSEYHLPLYVDGARLGYGLSSPINDVTLKDLNELTDAFYIGGTKVGALCGEALVFTHHNQPANFLTLVKQHGGLLAKGRLLGIQFLTLFTNDLYFKLSDNAIKTAMLIKAELKKKGYRFFIDSPTNQQFIIIENKQYASLKEKVRLSYWEKYDEDHIVVRICTSWATTTESVQELMRIL